MGQQIKDDKNFNVEWLARVVSASVRGDSPDLSMRQLAILLVAENATVPPGVKELTALLQIPKPSVTRAIDRLQSAQLVTRRPSIKDRRQVTVHILPEGTEYMQQIQRWTERRPRPVIGPAPGN